MFGVHVLLYGDHPDLARRCLHSLVDLDPLVVADVRIGLNEISEATRQVVAEFAGCCPVAVRLFREATCGQNVLKYPMMRRMLYDPYTPVTASHVMWFDDDSYVTAKPGWWLHLASLVAAEKPAVLGSPYTPGYRWTPIEVSAIRTQPWYTGRELSNKPTFMQGGWWVADLEFLAKWDYPFRQIAHNGGDVLLGELCRQQGAKLYSYRAGVAINADNSGRESQAKRRGATSPRPFERPPPYDYSHQDFAVTVTSLPGLEHDRR